MMKIFGILMLALPALVFAADLPEMVIGEKNIEPGVSLIFEGAIKDNVAPSNIFGAESDSDIHIEVVATWNDDAPRGSVTGGFVAYLDITALITNQDTGEDEFVRLDPHLNMSDNFHYARNTKLPGARDEIYSVVFSVSGPRISDVGMHFDWRQEVGERLVDEQTFKFSDLDFSLIAEATRR
jgi:hypothetical protein